MVRALLLSGGYGSRLGADTPKQYIEVEGKRVIAYSMETLLNSPLIDALYIVATVEWQSEIKTMISTMANGQKFVRFALPGENRQLSIYNGLLAMKEDAAACDSVLIHDAARPLLKESFIENMVEALKEHCGVLPVLALKDTVYMTDDKGRITSLLNRNMLKAGQAPEIFVYEKYLEANKRLLGNSGDPNEKPDIPDDGKLYMPIMSINGSTEPAILAGMDVVTIPGDEENFKITTKEDLDRFIGIISARRKSV